MNELGDLIGKIQWDKLGVVAVLATALIAVVMAFVKRWVVVGSLYDQKVKECDEQTEIARKSVDALGVLTAYFRGRGQQD